MKRALCALLAGLFALPLCAAAQDYPTRPLRMIVPYAPGGAVDVIGRAAAQKLSEQMGQPVIVDNRPGATGIVGSQALAKSAPDGYTVILTANQHYMVPYFTKNVPYDTVKDFTPIGLVAAGPAVLVVHPSVPVNSVAELIAHARAHPGKLYYGTSGIGSMQHLAGIMLGQMTGINIEHVPYKGGPPAVADLMAGQIAMGFLTASSVMPQARAGKLKALGVIEGRRWDGLPGVAPIGDTVPGYAVPETWFGVLGPAGMPAAIVTRLNGEIRKAVAAPEVKQRLEGIGFEVMTNTPEEFQARVKAETQLIHRIITAAGIKPE